MRLLHRGKPKQKGLNVPASHLVDFILNSHRLTSRTQTQRTGTQRTGTWYRWRLIGDRLQSIRKLNSPGSIASNR